MPNKQIIDYIKENLSTGISIEKIKKALLDTGWPEHEINEAINQARGLSSKSGTPPLPKKSSKKKSNIIASTTKGLKEEIIFLKRQNQNFEQRLFTIEKKLDVQPVEEIKVKEEFKPDKKTSTFEADIGLKWFNKVGILALVIGIGFFIKYAFDNNWISYLTRIIIGVIIGLILIIGGELISKKEKYFDLGLVLAGGGFAITYFVIYSAYHFEKYRYSIGISQLLDIVLLTLVVICAIFFSLKDNSKIIASEAFFLGFITSLLSQNFELLTLIYGLILTIGLIIIVLYKKWSFIGVGGIIATYLVYLFWYSDNKSKFFISTIFLIIYFIAYTLQSFLLSSDKNLKIESQNIAIIIINSVFFYFLYYLQIRRNYPDYNGLFTLILGIFYLIAYFVANKLNKEKLSATYLYLTILFVTLTIPIQLNNGITIIWALETVILTVLSFKLNINSLRYSSYIVGAITAFKTLMIDSWRLNKFVITNISGSTRFFSFLAAIITFYFVAWYLNRNKNCLTKNEEFISNIYLWAGFILTFFLVLLEMEKFWVSLGWITLATIILLFGFYFGKKQLRLQGIVLFGITTLKVFLYDTNSLDPLYRTISFIILGIILLLASFIYTKFKDKLKDII